MREHVVLRFVLDSLPPEAIVVLPATQFLTEKWHFVEEGRRSAIMAQSHVIYRAQGGLGGSAVPTQFSRRELSGINQQDLMQHLLFPQIWALVLSCNLKQRVLS